MLQFSKPLESKGLKVTLIITSCIAKSMQGQHSSINMEPFFDGSKEGEMAANIDKYFEGYKLIMPHKMVPSTTSSGSQITSSLIVSGTQHLKHWA